MPLEYHPCGGYSGTERRKLKLHVKLQVERLL